MILQQFVTVLQQQGVDIDEPTLRRHLRMGDGEDVGIDLDDFIQLMAIHLRRKVRHATVYPLGKQIGWLLRKAC